MHQHDDAEIDWDDFSSQLERGADLRAPMLRQAVAWLRELTQEDAPSRPAARGHRAAEGAGPVSTLPATGRPYRILDVGSGPGVVACMLAQEFPEAEVVAVDGTPALLERVAGRASEAGVGKRVGTRLAGLPEEFGLLAEEEPDLVWVSHVVHHLGDQQAALASIAGLLRPGGLVALAEGGLPPRFLPRDIGLGRPGLQARLDVANAEWFDDMRSALPGSVPAVEDWPGMLERAGLTRVASRTFLIDRPAPLAEEHLHYLHDHLARMRGLSEGRLSPGDLATLDRLLDPGDPAGILSRTDAYYLSADTVHVARRPVG
ncbi:SAM-dependent methyltransferase [Microtetraspora sp. NBRC 13810]|uniref:class I SAM-dependent methyltransferase n=1 Tax=Microtetraspora sp. NBRC 13810 TaxID=3030990 RepID=UPI0024A4A245|nr:class I SAM-dependent methyltransferase [Microtetraspora sp. NBRC 13810]GLW09843.1 SAM-dependent methyltransferase [Microtetraspora sp. NBRC 13810]